MTEYLKPEWMQNNPYRHEEGHPMRKARHDARLSGSVVPLGFEKGVYVELPCRIQTAHNEKGFNSAAGFTSVLYRQVTWGLPTSAASL